MKFALAACAVLAMTAGPAFGAQPIDQAPVRNVTMLTYSFDGSIVTGTQSHGSGGGAGKVAFNDVKAPGLTLFRKAGDACTTLMFSVTMSDQTTHTAHAAPSPTAGRCTYALTFTGKPGLKVVGASLSSCGGTFADIAVDPALFTLTGGAAHLNFTEPAAP